MKWTEEQHTVRAHLREHANRGGLEPDFIEAIGYVENRWRRSATNMTGADGARGGAWGPTQITERTARAVGYKGPMQAFNEDLNLAGLWTCLILNHERARRGPLTTLADYVAAWNAGRYDADRNDDGNLEELPPNHPTRKYLETAKTALDVIRKERGDAAATPRIS